MGPLAHQWGCCAIAKIKEDIMSLWYLLVVIGIVAASFWIAHLYSIHCRANGTTLRWHGALEGNLTFFSLQFVCVGLLTGHADGWVVSTMGVALGIIVVMRFAKNWRQPTDRAGD
jgi:hypothetical protein